MEAFGIDFDKINIRLIISTRRYLFIAIGLSLVSLATFFFFIFPRIQVVQQHRSELQTAQEELQASTEKLTLLQNVNQTTLFQQRERIEALLPNSKPLLPLISRLEQLSIDTGVVVTSFDTRPGQLSTQSAETKKQSTAALQSSETGVDTLPLTLTLYAPIDSIYTFLGGIDTLVPLADISGISLSSTKSPSSGTEVQEASQEGTPVYKADLDFQAYFYVGKPTSSGMNTLPDASLDPELLQKLQTFALPAQTAPSENIPTVIEGGKENLFE